MYPGWESNPHSLRNASLSRARLPIPPPGHLGKEDGKSSVRTCQEQNFRSSPDFGITPQAIQGKNAAHLCSKDGFMRPPRDFYTKSNGVLERVAKLVLRFTLVHFSHLYLHFCPIVIMTQKSAYPLNLTPTFEPCWNQVVLANSIILRI